MRKWPLWFIVTLAGCGGGVLTLVEEAGTDTSADSGGGDGASELDGRSPLPGEFFIDGSLCTRAYGYGPCEFDPDASGSWGVLEAMCDPVTGWCCSSELVYDSVTGLLSKCVCGQEPGCQPPSVCCAFPGEQTYRCTKQGETCPYWDPYLDAGSE